jgi:tRNA A37 threonylcarbamoyladenosine modification protein TsaB
MLLLIDTSNIEYIYLALASDKIFAEEKITAKFEQQEKLLISLQELFKKNKLSWDDIDGIVGLVQEDKNCWAQKKRFFRLL